jgi:hypothetical protein
LISSAASRTLVGTRFSLIAPVELPCDASVFCVVGGLIGDPSEDDDDHGEGSGLRGEIIEADVDKLATAPERAPPMIGIFRPSAKEGLRNSDGRRCLGGLFRYIKQNEWKQTGRGG